MATASSLPSEQPLCSVCLDVFTLPVSLPCGHNFCMACIRTYWDSKDRPCQCPVCIKTFDRRPELSVNTFISAMAAQFKKSVQVNAPGPDQRPAKHGEVSCDICTGTKLQALKSCLVCVSSFCETHLEPHHTTPALQGHTLVDPVENVEDMMCKRHQRPLELFCRTDQTCVCEFCTETDHKTHDAVPLEQGCRERKSQLRKTDEDLQQMIQERREKVQKVKLSIDACKRNAEKEISVGVELSSALVRAVETSQMELTEAIEAKLKAAEKRAEGFVQDLEREISELQRRSADLERLSRTTDPLHFLQSFPRPRPLPRPPPSDGWSQTSVHGDLSVGAAASHLEETLRKETERLSGVKLKMMQDYAVDVTLDPDTAHPELIVSEDGKLVQHGSKNNQLPDNPERFTNSLDILGKQGFSSGRFCYQVQVKGKTQWVLGVARESVNRKTFKSGCPGNGLWTVEMTNGYRALASTAVPLTLAARPQIVGVFVDYEEGEVVFYDAKERSLIYSFTGCVFTEKLYPYFNIYNGKNTDPVIITPVNPQCLTDILI